jgi:membrane protein DedA with SNARE-associated domain
VITSWLLGLPPLLLYLGLLAVVAAESSGLPVPGETSLIAVAILASQHQGLRIELVIATAALAAIVGDNIGYVLGRHAGRHLLTRTGRGMETRHRFLVQGEAFFEKHGSRAVFLARWLPGLRVVGSWLAGANHMRWRTFLLWNAVGGIAWATSIGLAAYLLGHVAATIFRDFGLVGVAVVLLAAILAFALHRRRRRRRAALAALGDDAG